MDEFKHDQEITNQINKIERLQVNNYSSKKLMMIRIQN